MARAAAQQGRPFVYRAPLEDVFQATLDTVRSLPGWEVIQARPEDCALQARARGRIFSPTMDHEFVLRTTDTGTAVHIRSRATRSQADHPDERTAAMFHAMMADRFTTREPGLKP